MERSKLISVILIVIIFLLIGIMTTIKVYDNHQKKLVLVAERRLEESARQCIIDEKCSEDETITLGTLIQHGYLESQVHPLTKEYLSEEIVIECKNYVCMTDIG